MATISFGLAPGGAAAAPPDMTDGNSLDGSGYNYFGWSVAGGTIDSSASCSAAGVTCTTLAQEDGFLQEEVVFSSGERYIRIMMTEDGGQTGDPSSSLDFATEAFTPFYTNTECTDMVDANSAVVLPDGSLPNEQLCQGLAATMVVREAATGFESAATVQRNFPKFFESSTADMFNINLDQTINTTDPDSGLPFADSFAHTAWSVYECGIGGSCSNIGNIGSSTDLSSTIGLDATESERFEYRSREGWMGRQTGGFNRSDPVVSTTEKTDVSGDFNDIVLGGRTMNGVKTGTETTFEYADSGGFTEQANSIETVWVASDLVDGFAYQRFTGPTNRTQPNVLTTDDEFLLDWGGDTGSVLDPFDWDTENFGAAPTGP